jgi:antitoxin (DNA-binding transcriptional repressor) of toxin-antitoxin stability system
MEFITMRELRSAGAAMRRKLREKKQLILTSNGRPIAVIADVQDDQVEQTLAALRQARAQLALARLREDAHASGRDQLTAEEIEAEIVAARAERDRQPTGDQPA